MIFHPNAGGPALPIVVFFCMLGGTQDVIMHTKL